MTDLLAVVIGTSAVTGAFTLGYVWCSLLCRRGHRQNEKSRK